MTEILLLEINEIPWKVINKYRKNKNFRNIKNFFDKSSNYTTHCVDKVGMLDPWVIWPTIHRGVDYKKHNIKNLGQDVSTFRGKPIWDVFLDNGSNIGIFGSLQSWPPKFPGDNGFYIPDTFAQNEKCIPESLNSFQKFNLQQVSKNGKVISKNSIYNVSSLLTFFSLPFYSVRLTTMSRILFQLVLEFFSKKHIAKRPSFQTLISWDIFKGLYNKKKIRFSTFFTNHIANIMHRYWDHIFYDGVTNIESSSNQIRTMDFAMKLLDDILRDVILMSKRNKNLKIFFLSGMGQDKIDHPEHEGFEAKIGNIKKFAETYGLSQEDYSPLLAMVPQIAINIKNKEKRIAFREKVLQSKTLNNKKLFSVIEEGNSLSISIITPKKKDILEGDFLFSDKNDKRKFSETGIEMLEMEAGQAYHIPEGIMSIYSSNSLRNAYSLNREIIFTDQIKNIILKEANIEAEGEKNL